MDEEVQIAEALGSCEAQRKMLVRSMLDNMQDTAVGVVRRSLEGMGEKGERNKRS